MEEPMSDEELAEVREFLTLPTSQSAYLACTVTDIRIHRLLARLDALQALVDKLPKTADGVPVVDGDELYHPSVGDNSMFGVHAETKAYWIWNSGPNEGSHWTDTISSCYSTREAALAAKVEGDAR